MSHHRKITTSLFLISIVIILASCSSSEMSESTIAFTTSDNIASIETTEIIVPTTSLLSTTVVTNTEIFETSVDYVAVARELVATAEVADYDQLTRFPGDYYQKAIKFTGEIILVREMEDAFIFFIGEDENYTKAWQVIYSTVAGGPRVLKGDNVVVYGRFDRAATVDDEDGNSVNVLIVASLMVEIKND